MKTEPTNDQVSKLPVWAQKYLRDMQTLAKTAERKVKAFGEQQTESPVSYVVHGDADTPHYLPLESTVKFQIGREWFSFHLEKGKIEVFSSSGILIQPLAVNHCSMRVDGE